MNSISARILALVIAGALAAAAGYFQGASHERAKWEKLQAENVAATMAAIAEQEAKARATEQATQRRNQEIQADATQQIDRARADADAGRADADRLRKQVAMLSAKRCPTSDTGSSTSSQADARADVLLNDVFGWSVDRAAELAEAYDRARIAGLACESAYDSLRRQQ